jgi:transcriptional regulator with XRE-family HTH domain
MEFGDQIKELRKRNSLTQEQFALKLNITRQAVSNWENNKNLPDLEMLILMSNIFETSLDELILGGSEMNNLTEKLIKDGSETRRAKINMVATAIGALLMFLGAILLFIKANSVEYIDEMGILHENFYLVPIGFLFISMGVIVMLTSTISYFLRRFFIK